MPARGKVKARGNIAAAALLFALSSSACVHQPAVASEGEIGPEAVLTGERTRPPQERYPTEMFFPEPYGRTWDATASTLASLGFPLEMAARDTGVFTTGWQVTQPNHEMQLAGARYVGRKVERLTVLVRPVAEGTRVTVSSQTVLASPRWSAAAPAAGHAVDVFSDSVTEYGLLADIGRVLGHAPARSAHPAYGSGLGRKGVLGSLGGEQ